MTLAQRQTIAYALADAKQVPCNAKEVRWLEDQLRHADLQLLAAEVERLKREKRLSFKGDDLRSQLGADSWILS